MEISIVIKMKQLKFETSMKNIPLGGNKEYVHYCLNPLVAEDPSGATVCTTQWNKIQSCYTSCNCATLVNSYQLD